MPNFNRDNDKILANFSAKVQEFSMGFIRVINLSFKAAVMLSGNRWRGEVAYLFRPFKDEWKKG
jgi:hypothetical protein